MIARSPPAVSACAALLTLGITSPAPRCHPPRPVRLSSTRIDGGIRPSGPDSWPVCRSCSTSRSTRSSTSAVVRTPLVHCRAARGPARAKLLHATGAPAPTGLIAAGATRLQQDCPAATSPRSVALLPVWAPPPRPCGDPPAVLGDAGVRPGARIPPARFRGRTPEAPRRPSAEVLLARRPDTRLPTLLPPPATGESNYGFAARTARPARPRQSPRCAAPAESAAAWGGRGPEPPRPPTDPARP